MHPCLPGPKRESSLWLSLLCLWLSRSRVAEVRLDLLDDRALFHSLTYTYVPTVRPRYQRVSFNAPGLCRSPCAATYSCPTVSSLALVATLGHRAQPLGRPDVCPGELVRTSWSRTSSNGGLLTLAMAHSRRPAAWGCQRAF